MKKLLFLVVVLPGFIQAQDLVSKRRGIAVKEVVYVSQLLEAVNNLQDLRNERAISGNADDADFQGITINGTSITHLSAYQYGILLDTVLPNISAVVYDNGINQNTLEGIRR